jgi:hypothetical protein
MADINLGVGGANSATGGYEIANSVKLQTAGVNSEFFNYTIGTTGDRTKGTVSMWIKRSVLSTTQCLWEQGNTNSESGRLFVRFDTNDTLRIATGSTVLRVTNRVFRDTSAWYHIVVSIDTTSGTADNRTRLYINGVEETSFSTKNNFSQNDSTGMNFEKQHIGLFTVDESSFASFNGYMAEVFGADGLVYAASDFGEFDSSGIWKPKDLSAISSSVGTNGFYMKFENAASMGAYSSNNGHGFSVQNINQNDQATDVPSNNFSTGNPLGPFRVGHWNFTDGATYAQYAGGNDWGSFTNTIAVGSGKWYVEIQAGGSDLFIGAGSEDYNFVGAGAGTGFPEIYYGYTGTNSVGYHANNGDVYNNGTQTVIGTTYTTNDIISVALDMDNGKIYFAKNGTYINSQNPVTGANSIALPDTSARYFIGGSSYGTGKNHRCNYGGYFPAYLISSAASDENGYGTFEYAPPSGYYALCTKNLAEYG